MVNFKCQRPTNDVSLKEFFGVAICKPAPSAVASDIRKNVITNPLILITSDCFWISTDATKRPVTTATGRLDF